MGTILVVDDERSVLQAFEGMLSQLGHKVITASNTKTASECVCDNVPDVVVTDLCMPGVNGLDAYRNVCAVNPKIPVIIMTGQGSMDIAIEAMKLGAFDYQLKPFDPESMVAAIERALQSVRLMQQNVELNPATVAHSADAIIGDSPVMQEVFKAIGRVALTDATVLIRGESGTGKELVARAIYQHSRRSGTPLVVVNCAAIPENLLESELFGHERGAFTGAEAQRIGKFQQAHGGTIFLDEIGDVTLTVQAKLLRTLQQKTIERVGGNETIQTDVRVLTATNRDLEQAISDRSFREDLYHRLNVVTIKVPPLRERRGDIPKLVDYFLNRFAHDLNIMSPQVTEEAMTTLQSFDWPGNVRELEHCIYRALLFTRGFPIQATDIVRACDAGQIANAPASYFEQDKLLEMVRHYLDSHSGEGTHERFLSEMEGLLVAEALDRTDGNQTHAARLLGLSRPTFHSKLQRFGGRFRRNQRD